jgi:ribosomal protein L2
MLLLKQINYKIYIRTFNPVGNSSRFKKRIVSYNNNNDKFKKLKIGYLSNAGRNKYGLITVRGRSKGFKKSFLSVDFKRN